MQRTYVGEFGDLFSLDEGESCQENQFIRAVVSRKGGGRFGSFLTSLHVLPQILLSSRYSPIMSDDAEKNEAPPGAAKGQEHQEKEEQEQAKPQEPEPQPEPEPEPKLEPEPEQEPEPEKPQEKLPPSQSPPQSPPAPEVPASPVMVTVTIEEDTVGGPQENGDPPGMRAGSAEELGTTPAPVTSPPTRSKSASLNDLKPQNSLNGGPRAVVRGSLSGSQVHLAGTAGSPRASLSRQASATGSTGGEAGEKPRDYIFIAALSCFCPIWPINIVAFVYSVMVSTKGLA